MEKRKVKMGLSAMMIVAVTFLILGVTFLPIGIAAYIGNWDVEGDINIFVAMFAGLGAVFLILGILFLVLEIKKRNNCRRLLEDGYYIMAEIISIDKNLAVNYGKHGHPYIVRCMIEDYDKTIHVFKSRNLFSYPGKDLEGQMVKVYLERNAHNKYKKYYVDIDEILGKVIEH